MQKEFCRKIPRSKIHVTTNFRVLVENGWLDDLKYLCAPTEYHYRRYCVKFTTDIGAAREFTRHRVFSFMQESTRYCNYSKDKFDNEITFIKPYWYKEVQLHSVTKNYTWQSIDSQGFGIKDDFFIHNCKVAEDCYTHLLEAGCKPQEARQVLPLATKTELVMCGFEEDWKHFFDLRLRGTTGAPHPDAKYLAQETWNLFKDNYDVEL